MFRDQKSFQTDLPLPRPRRETGLAGQCQQHRTCQQKISSADSAHGLLYGTEDGWKWGGGDPNPNPNPNPNVVTSTTFQLYVDHRIVSEQGYSLFSHF